MSQNIFKRREDMDRDLLWHTHTVSLHGWCVRHMNRFRCANFDFQNGGGFQFCVWVDKKFLQMYNLNKEAYKDKATFGCSNQLQSFHMPNPENKIYQTKFWCLLCSFCTGGTRHNKLLSVPFLHTCACLDTTIYTLAEIFSGHLEYSNFLFYSVLE